MWATKGIFSLKKKALVLVEGPLFCHQVAKFFQKKLKITDVCQIINYLMLQ
jgi:hypothetical protein